jgi:hypothetical protein
MIVFRCPKCGRFIGSKGGHHGQIAPHNSWNARRRSHRDWTRCAGSNSKIEKTTVRRTSYR